MTLTLDTRRRKFLKWLFVITGVCNGSFFLFIVSMTRDSVATWRAIVIGISFGLYFVTLVLLPVMVVWGTRRQRVTKTEAWWWLSVPPVIGLEFSAFINLDNATGAVAVLLPFSLLYPIAVVSSGVWALRTGYQAKTRQLIQNEKVMLALAVIAAVIAFIPWDKLHRGP